MVLVACTNGVESFEITFFAILSIVNECHLCSDLLLFFIFFPQLVAPETHVD